MMRARLAWIAALIGAVTIAACVIGPKQDDPVAGAANPEDAAADGPGGFDMDAAGTTPDGDKTSDGDGAAPQPDASSDASGGDAVGDALDGGGDALDGDALDATDATDAADGG